MQNSALKLIVTLLYSFLVAFSSLEYFYIIPPFLAMLFEIKSFIEIVKKVLALNLFIIFLVVFVAFENSDLALELFIRVNLILLLTTILFFKSDGFDIIRALNSLKAPRLFISSFYFTLVIIIYLKKELKNSFDSLKVRNFRANTSMFTYKTIGNLFGFLFVKALKKAEELQYTMVSRGFDGKIFLIPKNKICFIDILILSLTIFIIFVKLVLI